MRALVTGGSGFFGSALARHLLALGDEVRVFDRADATERDPRVEFHSGDVLDEQALRRACRDVDAVYHNVALVPLAKDTARFWAINRDGTRVMLEAAAAEGVKKVVYTSSSAVFGVPASNPVDESMPPRPREEYGRAKLAGEELCRASTASGLDVTVVRPRTILGPGRLGVFSILFEWVFQGCRIPVLGAGDNLYQFVHADDLARACALAARRPGPSLYHCGAERFGTMRELLEGLCRHAKTGATVRGVPRLPAVAAMRLSSALGLSPLGDYHSLMYGRSFYFDTAKARRELGWRALRSNDEMMAESYDWYVAHRDEVLAGGGPSLHRAAARPGVLALLRLLP